MSMKNMSVLKKLRIKDKINGIRTKTQKNRSAGKTKR